MVNDVHSHVASHASERGHALRIHQDGVADLALAGEVVGLDEGEFSAVESDKGPPVAVDAAGQHGNSRRKQFARSQQAGNGVEICVFVGQDDLHTIMIIGNLAQRSSGHYNG